MCHFVLFFESISDPGAFRRCVRLGLTPRSAHLREAPKKYFYIRILTITLSFLKIPSLLRTAALSASRYVPLFLSGKIEVFHVVFPTVTSAATAPQPRRGFPSWYAVTFAATSFGNETKCHPACPGYSQTFALNDSFIDYRNAPIK